MPDDPVDTSPTVRHQSPGARHWPAWLAVGLSALVYWRVARAFFFADDLMCLVTIVNRGFGFFVLQSFLGHLNVVRNLVFWVTWRLGGFDPRPYYGAALLTHLVNVWLTYRVGRALTGSAALAGLAAALWGTSPACVGTIGWYAVYGQALATTLLLVVLDRMLRSSPAQGGSARQLVAWGVLLIAGTACFGTGLGVAMAFPALVFLLQPATLRRRWRALAVAGFPLLVVAIYLAAKRVSALLAPLGPSEVLLGMAFDDLGQTVDVLWHLVAYGTSGLLLGFRFQPLAYPGTLTHAVIAAYVALLLAAFACGDGTVRRRLVALVVTALAAYGSIALGRAALFALFDLGSVAGARPLRYHYQGVMPLALALALALGTLARRAPAVAPTLLVAWIGLFAWDYAHAPWQVDEHVAARDWAVHARQQIEAAIDAGPPGEAVSIDNVAAPPSVIGILPHTNFPGLAGIFMLTHPGDMVRGHRVRFVEHVSSTYFAYHDAGSRYAGLFVSPDVAVESAAR